MACTLILINQEYQGVLSPNRYFHHLSMALAIPAGSIVNTATVRIHTAIPRMTRENSPALA